MSITTVGKQIAKSVYTATTMIIKLEQGFTLKIENVQPLDERPSKWYVYFMDRNNFVGATGHFISEAEAFNNLEDFVSLAVIAYGKQYARFNQMPIIAVEGNSLVVKINGEYDYEYSYFNRDQ